MRSSRTDSLFALQPAWNEKAFKLKQLLGRKLDVNNFLRYLYEHIGLLSCAFGPSIFKTFRPPKEMPGTQKNTGSYSLQKSGSKPVFSAATDMTPSKNSRSSTGERREIKEPTSPPSGESAEVEGRRMYQCAFCSATHYLNLCPQFMVLKGEERGKFC